MESRWSNLKQDAVELRKKGQSIREIETRLDIPRSTLSGWLRGIRMSPKHVARLEAKRVRGLVRARVAAAAWHNAQKEKRLAKAAKEGASILRRLPDNEYVLELALAMLYLGEGSKTNGQTTLGSSDPRIVKFYINALRKLYHVPTPGIRCYLHLRADQEPASLVRYWSKVTGLPAANFGKSLIDKRTIKSPTYPRYKGVCTVHCGRVAIQRRLMYIANGYCDRIVEPRMRP
jgi:hypothetical protein